MAVQTKPSIFPAAVLPAMATEPKEFMVDCISTLEMENMEPCIPAGMPMRAISFSLRL